MRMLSKKIQFGVLLLLCQLGVIQAAPSVTVEDNQNASHKVVPADKAPTQATLVTTDISQMDTQADALLRDVYHLVQNRENRLWFIDSEELKTLQTDALIILCTASNELRTNAQHRLQQMPANQIDLRARWIKENKDLGKVSRLMRDNRAFLLFQSAFSRVPSDCPFWLEPEVPYVEKHRPTEQWFLAADGGGMLNILPASKPLRLGFGGSGRLLVGHGINESWVIKSGIEFGGAGLVDQDSDVNEVELEFFAGMPIALRYLTEIWFLEGDLGPIAVGAAWRERPEIGVRASASGGIVSARMGSFQPWFGFRVSADYLPMRDSSQATILRSGFRFGVDYRPL